MDTENTEMINNGNKQPITGNGGRRNDKEDEGTTKETDKGERQSEGRGVGGALGLPTRDTVTTSVKPGDL